MTIIFRYVVFQILKFMGIVMGMVVGIYIAVDFFERIDNFLEVGLPYTKAITFLIYKTPFIMAQIFPVSILLAVIIVLGIMAKHNEIVALRSGGVSLYYLLRPALTIGFFSSLALFLFAETVVPVTMDKSNHIWLREVKREAALVSKEKDIWLKENKTIVNIRYYNQAEKSLYGLALNFFDDSFRLAGRINARKGVFKNGEWLLMDLMEQRLDGKTGKYNITHHDEKRVTFGMIPDDLQRVVKKSEEMGFAELYKYIEKVEGEGYDATNYRVDLHAKVAFPFICIILSLVGTGIALRSDMKDRVPLAVACGIVVAFFYWVFYSFCVSLGYGEVLPPIIAAWTANFVFTCIGVLLLFYTD